MATTVKTEHRNCLECKKPFMAFLGEVNRGGGKVCSRACYYKYQKRTRPKEEKSWAWKGKNVGREALHNWVQKKLGKPRKCEACGTTKAKIFDWANKSRKYKRDITDWIRLCRKCHAKYDKDIKVAKWRESVRMLGWNVKNN